MRRRAARLRIGVRALPHQRRAAKRTGARHRQHAREPADHDGRHVRRRATAPPGIRRRAVAGPSRGPVPGLARDRQGRARPGKSAAGAGGEGSPRRVRAGSCHHTGTGASRLHHVRPRRRGPLPAHAHVGRRPAGPRSRAPARPGERPARPLCRGASRIPACAGRIRAAAVRRCATDGLRTLQRRVDEPVARRLLALAPVFRQGPGRGRSLHGARKRSRRRHLPGTLGPVSRSEPPHRRAGGCRPRPEDRRTALVRSRSPRVCHRHARFRAQADRPRRRSGKAVPGRDRRPLAPPGCGLLRSCARLRGARRNRASAGTTRGGSALGKRSPANPKTPRRGDVLGKRRSAQPARRGPREAGIVVGVLALRPPAALAGVAQIADRTRLVRSRPARAAQLPRAR
jgi:hypothetical protein